MSVFSGPEIPNSGLILQLDAANTRSYSNYNMATYSQDFTNAVYTNDAGLVSATGLLAPDGTLTASTLTDDSTSAYKKFSRTFTVPNDGSTYNVSIHIKKTTGGTSPRTGFNLSFTGGTAVNATPRFNTDTGAGATTENNDYWRFSYTFTNNSSGNTNFSVSYYPATGPYNGSDTPTATGSQTVWGLQVTCGARLLPYMANTTSSYTLWSDLSGNGSNATLMDSTAYDVGSFSFNGVANRINGSNTNTIKWSADGTVGYQTMTISLWIKSTDAAGNYFSSPWNGSGQYNMQVKPDGFYLLCGSAASPTGLTIDTSLRDGNWKNLVCWMDGTNMGYYLNSIISSSKAHGLTGNIPTAGNSNIQICLMSLYPYNSGWAGNTNFSIAGNMSMCSIYNRVLSASEVSQNFEALRGRYGI